MAEVPDAGIPPQEVERRLEDLRALYKFGLALQAMRFVDTPSEVRERTAPPPPRRPPPESSK
jgi:hypothetical protein